MGESEKENPKGSDPYKKATKEASKGKILWDDILKYEHNEPDENKGLGRVMKIESPLMPVSVKQVCKERVPDQVKEVKIERGHKYFVSHQKKIGTENHKDRKTSDRSKDPIGAKKRHGPKDATNETSKDKASGKGIYDEMVGRDKELENQYGSASKKKKKDMHRNVNSSKEASKEKSRDHTRESYRDPRKCKYAKDTLTSESFGIRRYQSLKRIKACIYQGILQRLCQRSWERIEWN